MRVAIVNQFHAGDVIMSRALIQRIRPLLIDRVALHLECKPQYYYLWEDFGLPMCTHDPDPAVQRIDLWFGNGGDLLGVTGMTHATQVTSYNRQAQLLDLPLLEGAEASPSLDLPDRPIKNPPGVLVENGPVTSGQPTQGFNDLLPKLARTFPKVHFYCTGALPEDHDLPPTVVDMSSKNLIEIAAVSHKCMAMLSRLSGPFIATLTDRNRGRLKRLVHGEPIGCPIWDESDVEYFSRPGLMLRRLGDLLEAPHPMPEAIRQQQHKQRAVPPTKEWIQRRDYERQILTRLDRSSDPSASLFLCQTQEPTPMDTIGSLVDKLITVDLKMWHNQEDLYAIRRMTPKEFSKRYEGSLDELHRTVARCCDLNVQRSRLMDAIDEKISESIEAGTADTAKQHKTY